ncbi:MAG: N-6 DNA methylase [Kiritimatiellia bacterium]|nr:N-6 DNA methylase [Kiritimatiellia bacterium]
MLRVYTTHLRGLITHYFERFGGSGHARLRLSDGMMAPRSQDEGGSRHAARVFQFKETLDFPLVFVMLTPNKLGETLNASEFIAKWKKVELKERSAAQEHFLDLCRMLGHPTPAEADPTGEIFCFERGAEKHGGGDGFADVWKKDFFGWEYKGKHKDLDKAYNQLLLYRDALANPPLLVVCDLDRIVVRTNFTKTVSVTHEIPLDRLGEPRSLEILRAVFFDPEKLRPGKTSVAITQEAAQYFADMAESMRKRGLDSADVAHFLDRVVFCLFAEDIGLLPNQIFTRITEKSGGDPAKFGRFIVQLFEAMATGGEFGLETILHFNGSLFDAATVPDLTADEVTRITASARLDWSSVEPSIFGTLFERGLDPAKRSQLGAHFTGKEDIDLIVDVVVMQPLLREWEETKQIVATLLATGKKGRAAWPKPPAGDGRHVEPTRPTLTPAVLKKARAEAEVLIQRFLTRLQSVKVLDPACGSGNFLYVALQKLKDLEKTVILHSMDSGLASFFPMIGPWQLYGIELNPYAHDLAQMTVWIGWLQWLKFNGFGSPEEPILRAMSANFQNRDAILDLSDPAKPKEPDWPKVDFIIGNPPFLGGKIIRRELGGEYVEKLFACYGKRIPNFSDLCCYWFEKARAHIENGGAKRAGLLATQGIRGGSNREVLKRIKQTGDIFWAISDKDWVLDGANVHVSLIAFDGGNEEKRILDGREVDEINANLSTASNAAMARGLLDNKGVCYIGVMKAGPFDISEAEAGAMLNIPNANGRPNSDVLRPRLNAKDILQRQAGGWIIDFGVKMPMAVACLYQAPWAIVEEKVKPLRLVNRRKRFADKWWIHGEARPGMRKCLAGLQRFIVTPEVSKHRIFAWLDSVFLADHQTRAFGRDDDFFFGVLQSRAHEIWALKLGTRLETRPRYTPSTCFETFPIPKPSPAQEQAIAEAARELNELRERWLNPPEWTREEVLEFPGTPGGPWSRFIVPGTNTVRYPRIVPKDDASAALLKKRTLTNLYNERPTWLDLAHKKLDTAVFAAYGWTADISEDQILERLLTLNTELVSHSISPDAKP